MDMSRFLEDGPINSEIYLNYPLFYEFSFIINKICLLKLLNIICNILTAACCFFNKGNIFNKATNPMKFLSTMVAILVFLGSIQPTTSTFTKLGVHLSYQKGNQKQFKEYIDRFSNPACQYIEQFNVMVSPKAEKQFKELLQQHQKQPIPIHYYVLSQKQAMMKLKLPTKSKANMFYISSIFLNEEQCQDLKDYIDLANVKSMSGIFGLMGQWESTATIQTDLKRSEDQIFYFDKREGDHYSLVEDIRLIPRHYLELANSGIKEVVEMRKVINYFSEDIFFNFLVAHFYPQLKPKPISFPNTIHVDLEEGEQFQQKCVIMRKMINILGYVPVYNQRRKFDKTVWKNPNTGKIVELKKQQLIMQINKNNKKKGPQQHRRLDVVEAEQRTDLSNFGKEYENIVLNVLTAICILLVLAVASFVVMTRNLQSKIESLPKKQNCQ